MHINLQKILVEFPVSSGKKRAVDTVSLSITNGERVGIIGCNGAGKTTLLQVMAGLLRPTSGNIDVVGHVSCVMTLGVGLREEMTGRENIYVDGELNGRSHAEIRLLEQEIISFAELGEFIDRPIRTYSTGMKARLAFALLTFVEPEILIIDEALSVGDAEFAKKASRKMRELCENGKIVVLVSHSMKAINDMCDRCIWMDKGQIIMDGPAKEVTEAYTEEIRKRDESEMLERFRRRIGSASYKAGFSVNSLDFLDDNGNAKLVWQSDQELKIKFSVDCSLPIKMPDFRITFEKIDGNILLENTAIADGFSAESIEGNAEFEIDFGKLRFGQDTYEARLELWETVTPSQPELLASFSNVIRVDRPLDILDSPAYFHEVHLTVKPPINRVEG